MALRLVYETVEHVPDRFPDVRPVVHELPVDAVENRLEVVPLAWVLATVQLVTDTAAAVYRKSG